MELTQIGETGIKRYILSKTALPMKSMPNTTVEKQLKPLIIQQETPDNVLNRVFKTAEYERLTDHDSIIKHLIAYQKGGDHRRWDEYAGKIPQELRDTWALILSECRRNGFIAPYVFNGKLQWRRIMTTGKQADLCTMCSRDCTLRNDIDEGNVKWRRQNQNGYHEPAACWKRD